MNRYVKKYNDIIFIAEWGSVSFDPSLDSEYTQAYLAWVAEGNTAEEWQASNGFV